MSNDPEKAEEDRVQLEAATKLAAVIEKVLEVARRDYPTIKRWTAATALVRAGIALAEMDMPRPAAAGWLHAIADEIGREPGAMPDDCAGSA